MKLADVSVRRPVLAGVMNAALMVIGIVAFSGIGVDLLPKADFPIVTVTAIYPGADPKAVETKVIDKLEERLNTIGGIKELRSFSLENVGQVIIQFEMEMDLERVAQDVREKVAETQRDLPSDLDPPVVAKFDIGSAPIMAVALGGEVPFAELSRFAKDQVKAQLEKVNGVGSIDLVGGREREIHVWVDRDRLGAFNLTFQELAMTLKTQNLEVPAGKITAGGEELVVKTKGEVASVEEIGNIVIADILGATIHVKDVAQVEDGLEEEASASSLNGRQAVALQIRKQSGANTVAVAHRVKAELETIRKALPAGMELSIPTDDSLFVEESIHDVQIDLILGAALTVIIIFFFLVDWRATLISAIALPTSVVATVGFIGAMGFTFNYLTMLALALSIGMLIDDAIVVIENIHRHMAMGKPPEQAAREATAEIGLAVMATTAAIVAVFMPVAIMKGMVGQFFFQFGLTVSFAVGVSLLVSFTLTPMLASRILKSAHGARPGLLARVVESTFGAIERAYRWLLAQALRHRAVTMVAAVGVLVASVAVAGLVKQELLPDADQGRFTVEFELPPGTSLAASKRFAEQLRQDVAKLPGAELQFTTIGGGPRGTVTKGSMHVGLVDRSARDFSARQAVDYLRGALGDRAPAKVAVEIPMLINVGGLMRAAPVQYSLRGDDLDSLDRSARALMDAMHAKGGYVDVDMSARGGKPELSVQIDRDRAASLGVPVAVAAMALRTLVAGDKVTELAEAADRIDVRMRLADRDRRSPEDLAGIKLKSTFGQVVELGNLVRMERTTGPAEIEHVNRQRQVLVMSNLQGKALGEAVSEINAMSAEILPAGVTAKWSGLAEVMRESFGELYKALVLAVLLTYLILAAQFESLIHPFVIMFALPLSVVGALGALAVLDVSLNIFSMIGFIMLMGIVTKNGVLLVDYTNTLRSRGMSRDEALLAAGPVRLRPILMTSIATISGMLPVALGRGLGGEMRAPMAVVVIGGLITSTLLTLVIVPVIYSLMDRFARRKYERPGEEIHRPAPRTAHAT